MADVLGKKISELAETTDLAGLYTIGSDRNNQSKKVPLQFVKEAADYANAQGDYAKGVGDTIQGNTGVNEYPAFSSSTQYAAGSVVRYNNKLYRFTALHPAGAWVGTDAIETSIKAETDVKLTELESKTNRASDMTFRKTIAEFVRYQGAVMSSGKWGGVGNDNNMHILVPVYGGDAIKLKGGFVFYFYFLSEYSKAANAEQVLNVVGAINGYNPANGVMTYTAPEGAKYMIVQIVQNGVETLPSVLSVNGYDLTTGLQEKLNTKMDIDANLYPSIDNATGITIDSFHRFQGTIQSSGKWAGVTDAWNFILLRVKGGDSIKLQSGNTFVFYFLSDFEPPINGGEVQHTIGALQGYNSANGVMTYTAPEGAKYMPIFVRANNVEHKPSVLSVNGYDLLQSTQDHISKLEFITKEYVIDANGNGDFTTLRDAVEFCYPKYPNVSTLKNKELYLLKLMPGTYDIRSYYTNEEWNASGFVGLTLPRSCKLLGMGRKREDVVITCTSETSKSEISTLNIEDDVAMENLTIYGNNIRYVIHDDYSYYPYANLHGSYRDIKNVDFIGENLTYNCVYGSGTKGGADWKFENCNFINEDGAMAFSTHDRNGYIENALPENRLFKNCKFVGHSNNTIRLIPLTSQSEQNISFEGCLFNSFNIDARNATSHYDVKGYGNNKGYILTFEVDNEIARKSAPQFADEVTFVA